MKNVPYEANGVPRPVLNVTVKDPLQRSGIDLLVGIDTGFDGGLLIALNEYLGLKLQEFEEPSSSFVAHSAFGATVKLRSSRGLADAGGMISECSVYTSPFLLRPSLGRELLNKLKVTLDGPVERLVFD